MQDWTKVVEDGPAERQFLRPAWFRAWELAYGDDRNWRRPVRYLPLSDGRASQGILPLATQRIGPFRFASVCGTFLPFRGVPYCGEPAALAAEAVTLLRKSGARGGVRFGPMPNTDPFLNALIAELTKAGWRILRQEVGEEYIIENPGTAEQYAASLTSSRRQHVERYWRKLCQQGPTELRHHNGCSPDEWREVFRDIRTVEAHSWVAQSGEPRFLGARNELFWETLLADEWFSQAIHVWLIFHQGMAVSFYVSIDAGSTRFGIANSFDARVAKFSTGAKIFQQAIYDAFARGIQELNTGLGDTGYKMQFLARASSMLIDVVAFSPSFVGTIAYLAAQTKRSMSRLQRSRRPSQPATSAPEREPGAITFPTIPAKPVGRVPIEVSSS